MTERQGATDKLRGAVTGQMTKEPQSFPKMLEVYAGQVAAALPKHITPERMIRIALTAFRNTPKLGECDPKSVFACVVMSAQLGLEVGILGQAFLVPYKTRNGMICQFIPGWQGLQDLVNRSGRASTWTKAVYEGDEFEYEEGTSPFIRHVPMGVYDEKKITHVYAVGRVKGAEYPVTEVWPIARVREHRDRYNKVGDRHYSFNNWEQYAKKVPLMQVFKYVPKSVEMATVLSLDHAAEQGQQSLSLKDALRADYLPPPADDSGPGDDADPNANDAGAKALPEDIAGQVAYLRGANTEEELAGRYKEVSAKHRDKDNIPLDLEATRNERREFIQARDAKARGEG